MNIKDKYKLFQWLEILIWIIILSVAISSVKSYNLKKHNELKRYQIFLPDVDGLISGSPVRMMGVQIGYVETVKIVRNEVYVKFVLTEKDITLPKGVIATVEFSGMAGSKSLEIYPPTSTSIASNKLIAIQSPRRLNDALGLLCDMFNQLGAMLQKGAHFMDEMTDYMPEPEDISVIETVNKSSNQIKGFNNLLEDLSDKRFKMKKNLKKRMKKYE